MDNFVYHPETDKQIKNYISKPLHALLIQGHKGSGKSTLLNLMAASVLGLEQSKLINYPHVMMISPDDKNKIAIDVVRNIDHFLSLSVPGAQNKINRVILIDNADQMTTEAQNALLKHLEEPPVNTIFMLSVTNTTMILPTLLSRTFTLRLRQPTRNSLIDMLIGQGYNEVDVKRAIGLSGGLPGLALAILNGSDSHPLSKASAMARTIISSSRYQRLILVNDLTKDLQLLTNTLEVIELMASAAIERSKAEQVPKWQHILTITYQTKNNLLKNSNIKLNITRFMLALGQ